MQILFVLVVVGLVLGTFATNENATTRALLELFLGVAFGAYQQSGVVEIIILG
jgi:hypothetical protein